MVPANRGLFCSRNAVYGLVERLFHPWLGMRFQCA